MMKYQALVKIGNLYNWTELSNKNVFMEILTKLHKQRKIELRTDECKLLLPLIVEAERVIRK